MDINALTKRAIEQRGIDAGEAIALTKLQDAPLIMLFAAASIVREHFRGKVADLCAIVSAKTGACPEDCAYCAQSSRSKAAITASPLMPVEQVLDRAQRARSQGASRFCIVTSGKHPSPDELKRIAQMIEGVRALGLLPCATLGLLEADDLRALKDAGLHRFHHNLETSRAYFPQICSSHTYDDKLRTIAAAKEAGLSLCCGGIFGLGESWQDRIDMAMEIRALGADSVPMNFLVPVKGTPLGERTALAPMEALKVIAIYRMLLPEREVRVCGGRLQTLGELNSMVFAAGADGLLTGDCLTVAGRSASDDMALARACGLMPRGCF